MTINTHRSVQAPAAVIMIRPHQFHPNGETAADNAFQCHPDPASDATTQKALANEAYAEVTRAAQHLDAHGIKVHLFEDTGKTTPDSVFPNNWISTHPGGHIALYPMYAKSRRAERRADVVEMLKDHYRVQDVIDYSGLERDDVFLEGTGAMVLDHLDRVAYAVRSNRTDPVALERFCTHFNYEPMAFDATDPTGQAVYHTNVLMCIATRFALIGLDMITDDARRQHIVQRLEESGKEVIALSTEQIAQFAGNAIELQGRDARYLALSQTAYDSLSPEQISAIEASARPLPLDVPTIEMSGGSVRCMIAGVHLSPRA